MRAEKRSTVVRKDQIVHAAMDVVGRHGLAQLSMAAVAGRVGVVPSALYRHFDGKEAMLDACVGALRSTLLDNIRVVCGETADCLDRLQRLLRRHTQLVERNPAIPRIVFSGEVTGGSKKRRAALDAAIQAYLRGVQEIVRQGQQAGGVRRELDASVVAMMFLGLVQPSAFRSYLSDGKFDVRRNVEKAWRILAEAIRTR